MAELERTKTQLPETVIKVLKPSWPGGDGLAQTIQPRRAE